VDGRSAVEQGPYGGEEALVGWPGGGLMGQEPTLGQVVEVGEGRVHRAAVRGNRELLVRRVVGGSVVHQVWRTKRNLLNGALLEEVVVVVVVVDVVASSCHWCQKLALRHHLRSGVVLAVVLGAGRCQQAPAVVMRFTG